VTETVDVVVIGMGPGGEEAAGKLAEAGLAVVGIDELLVGGECPYWGCIPSKMMVRAADLLAEARRVRGMAGSAEVEPDWAPVARRIRDEATDDWDDRVAVERFQGKGGTFVRGHGRLAGPGRVVVGDREFAARKAVVVATGSQAAIPPIPGLADVDYWTNRDAIETTAVPTSLVVLGGGAVGVELGQVFARFGAQVTVVERMERLLALEEPEAGDVLAQAFGPEGIAMRFGRTTTEVGKGGDGIVVDLDDGDRVTGQHLLVATGRRVDVAAAGLDTVGVPPDARAAPVDDHLRVAPGVWAVGDVTGKGAFTHVAMYQARIAVADILGRPHEPADYKALPRVTFTDPEVGAVGLTEKEATEKGVRARVGTASVPRTTRGWIHKATGFIKLVEDGDRGVLVGATTMCPSGGEVIGLLALAVHAEIPTDRLRTMIYAYPTFHRGIESALRDLDAGR
jgi:pyruvate/2-oxoglutarate dehydrogenase complex dihydrolipoamide dehydrogenase (E3) component